MEVKPSSFFSWIALLPVLLCLGVFFLYVFSNPFDGSAFDYTFQIAQVFLHGSLGLDHPPAAILNEMIPLNGKFYSVFPLGSVLTMLPVAVLGVFGVLQDFPGVIVAAFVASIATLFFWLLSGKYQTSITRRIVLTLLPVLGTWMWANLAFGGAWQIALGLAVVGELGALYFLIIKRLPFVAGVFFALAFGNRTELILLSPLFLFLLSRSPKIRSKKIFSWPFPWRDSVSFFSVPILLGVATMAYNFLRFGSALDFGYAHIPGVLQEPWYKHGIFSLHAIWPNIREMLLTLWKHVPHFPYLVPTGFGGSIFLCSPYLIFLFRRGARDVFLKRLAWGALIVLTFVLWCHGNPGGWQFSYRYAIELLPWMFLILLESSPKRVGWVEWLLLYLSIAVNTYGMYVFLWTNWILG